MIIGGKSYYYGAYLEKNGLDKKHIIEQEKGTPVSIKNIQNFKSVKQKLTVTNPTDVYDSSNSLPFTPNIEDILYQPYTYGNDAVKEKFGESDSFRVNGNQQWIVFSKKLYDSGFFEGKSDEEIQEIDSLLQQFTNGLDSFNLRTYIKDYAETAILSRPINEMIPGHSTAHSGLSRETTYYMTKKDWETELESSTKALQYFCNTFVPEEYQNEFGGLIEQFYAFNSQSLENYQSPYELTGIPYLAGVTERGGQESEQEDDESMSDSAFTPQTKKNTNNYMDTIRAFFSQLASSKGKDRQYFLNHFLTDIQNNELGHDRDLLNKRMKDSWVKMFELEEKIENKISTNETL